MEQTTLYYREGNSDKVYQVSLEPRAGGYVVQFAYGRRGTTLQTGTKTEQAVPYATAKRIYEKLLSGKMAKGYTPGADGVLYQQTPNADRDAGIHCQLLNTAEEGDVQRLLEDPAWWMQEKYDGRRMLIRKQAAETRGINRLGLVVALPENLVQELAVCPANTVLDGEIIGDSFFAFDLLLEAGESLTSLRFGERYVRLTELLRSFPREKVRHVPTAYNAAEKIALFDLLRDGRAEGVVFKHIEGVYTPGRPAAGGSQLKFKFCATASFIVGKINAKRSVSLLLFTGDRIRAASNVTIPKNHPVPQPGQVIECRYLYAFRESGSIYQPVYLGTRDDIRAEECVTDQLKFKNVQLEAAA